MTLNNLGIQVQSIGLQLSSNINSNFGIQLGNIGIQISKISMEITNKVSQMIDMMNQMPNNLMNINMMNQMPNNLMNINMMNQNPNNLMNNNLENNVLLDDYKNNENKNKYSGEKMNIYFERNGKLEIIVAYSDMSIENLIKEYLKKYNIIEYLKRYLKNDDKEYLNEENIENILTFSYNTQKLNIKDQRNLKELFRSYSKIIVHETQLYNYINYYIIEIYDVDVSALRNDYKFYNLGNFCLSKNINPLICKQIVEKLDNKKEKSKKYNEYFNEIKEKIYSYFNGMYLLDFIKKLSANEYLSEEILNKFRNFHVKN